MYIDLLFQASRVHLGMQEPRMCREAGITYCSPSFLEEEKLWVSIYMRPVTYKWKHITSGGTGFHVVYVFTEDVKRFPLLLAHWNRAEDWEYSPCSNPLSVLE